MTNLLETTNKIEIEFRAGRLLVDANIDAIGLELLAAIVGQIEMNLMNIQPAADANGPNWNYTTTEGGPE